jgi:CRISPR-associated Csx2 family protein
MSLARKVFISFLGANKYEETQYYYQSDKSDLTAPVFYVQEALCNIVAKDWTANDQFLVFTTEKAAEYNWHKRVSQGEHKPTNRAAKFEDDRILKDTLKTAFKGHSENIHIPNGDNETEIWQIFDIILAKIKNGDKLFLDITFGFRFIPTFATTLLNYAKLIKDISIGGIYYGNYEARDEHNVAPIINLTNIEILQDWTAASESFIKTGSVAMLKKLIRPTNKKLAEDLEAFSLAISTIRGKTICYDFPIDALKQEIQAISNSQIATQLNLILAKIMDKIALFQTSSTLNGFYAVQWCITHKMFPQAYTFLLETTKSYIIEKIWATDPNLSNLILNHDIREAVNGALIESQHFNLKHITEKMPIVHHHKITELCRFVLSLNINLHYKKLTTKKGLRNDINHGGLLADAATPDKLISELSTIFAAIKTCLGI